MLSCDDVARYFLAKQDEDAGDTISNLKLQKLVYYAQGCALALLDRPLFKDPIWAWTHGPVVDSLYHEYKRWEAGAIPPPEDMDFTLYSHDEREVLDEVYEVYGQFSAWKLRDMTHSEPPWLETPNDSIIDQGVMKDYFKTLVHA